MTDTGIAPTTILFFIFLVLKLTHFIDWSWWWVFAPVIFEGIARGLVAVYAEWRRMN